MTHLLWPAYILWYNIIFDNFRSHNRHNSDYPPAWQVVLYECQEASAKELVPDWREM
jgi:hypothetical protein